MQLEDHACSPSSTKTSGTQTVQRPIPQKSVFGVRLIPNFKTNFGATAQLLVSFAYKDVCVFSAAVKNQAFTMSLYTAGK